MSIDNLYLNGHSIYIATKTFQRRKHHKKRINKKWLKRYGCYELNMMPHNEVIMLEDGVIYMTKRTWEKMKPALIDLCLQRLDDKADVR